GNGKGFDYALKWSDFDKISDETNNCLKINCCVQYYCDTTTVVNSSYENVNDSSGCLRNDLKKLLSSGIQSDVRITTKDGYEFNAHSLLLMSRSKVFKKLLSNSEDKIISFTSFNGSTVQAVLDFVYTDKIDDLNVIDIELLKAAEMYRLSKLQTICETHLLSKVNIETCIDLLLAADDNHCLKLRDHILSFIVANIKFLKSADFAKLQQRITLFLDIFSHL
ncbi:speckle-type POZ protein B-like protein, partial [Leptotrombidium deliense]